MCSGKHRGLGVHLSFVRSITMDSWKDLELEKMKVCLCLSKLKEVEHFFFLLNITFNLQVGGNKNAIEFFKSQPDWNEDMTLGVKYNTKAAALYRDKVGRIAYLIDPLT